MKEGNYICDNCGRKENYSMCGGSACKDRDSKTEICDDCYHEKYERTCPICEEYYDIPTKPRNHFFYSNNKDAGIAPGFYKVLKFPVFRSDGFDGYILEENIKKVSDNLVYKNDGYGSGKILSDTNFICKECFDKKGIDRHHVEMHIRKELTRVVKTDKKLKKYKWTVKISPEYFKGLKTKNKYSIHKWRKNIRIKSDKNKKTQEIEIIKYPL